MHAWYVDDTPWRRDDVNKLNPAVFEDVSSWYESFQDRNVAPGLLVIHARNNEMFQTMSASGLGAFDELVRNWVVKTVVGAGGRAILFTGGSAENAPWGTLATDLADLEEGRHYVRCEWFAPWRDVDWSRVADLQDVGADFRVSTLLSTQYNAQQAPAIECLAALSVLCQGYLAVYSAAGEPQSKDVSDALSAMGWKDLCEERRKADSAEFDMYLKSLASKFGNLDQTYWLQPFEGESANLTGLVKKEWRHEKGADEAVVSLIEQIEIGTIDPDQIAKAYLSLVGQLK